MRGPCTGPPASCHPGAHRLNRILNFGCFPIEYGLTRSMHRAIRVLKIFEPRDPLRRASWPSNPLLPLPRTPYQIPEPPLILIPCMAHHTSNTIEPHSPPDPPTLSRPLTHSNPSNPLTHRTHQPTEPSYPTTPFYLTTPSYPT
jgi:hypothetical protein